MNENNDYELDKRYYIMPKSFKNSGGAFNGEIPMEILKYILIIGGGIYLSTEIFFAPFFDKNLVLGIRVGLFIFLALLHFGIMMIFHMNIDAFARVIYSYMTNVKKYRYERRDAKYVKRQQEKQSK